MTTTSYTLYCFAQSGNSYKAALMLNLCGAKWTPRFVDFFNGETRTPEYRKNVNEMGEAPVLEYGNTRLAQSGVILDYLAEEKEDLAVQRAADKIRSAYGKALLDGQKTRDLGGELGTDQFTDAVIERLNG